MGPAELAIIWVALCLVAAFVASQRGNSPLTIFFVSLLLSPVVGLIIAVVQRPAPSKSAQIAAPVTAASAVGVADELAKLAVLRDRGTITPDEFDRQRAILLPPSQAWSPQSQAPGGTVCGRCGKPLSPAWKGKCQHCGAFYSEFPPRPTTWIGPNDQPEAPLSRPETAQTIAGLAWLACAALTAYLAWLQWSTAAAYRAVGLGPGDLEIYAAWNVLSAILTGYFGARLLTGTTRRMLDASAAWAVLSVLFGVVQIGSGATNDIFFLSIVAAAIAGILSFVARDALPRPTPTQLPASTPTPTPPASARIQPTATTTPARRMGTVVTPTYLVADEPTFVPNAPAPAQVAPAPDPAAPVAVVVAMEPAVVPEAEGPPPVAKAPASRTASRPLVVLVVAIAFLAVGAVGFALLSGGSGPFAAASPSPAPTLTPTATPVGATPIPFNGTGPIAFGSVYDPDTLAITNPAATFKRTANPIAWSAALKGPIGTSSLTFSMSSRTASGDETFVYTEPIAIDNPDGDTIAASNDLAVLTGNKAGTYVVRLLRGPDVLAEGTFTLTK